MKVMEKTTVNLVNGKILKVRGTFEEVCEGFRSKQDVTLFRSRISSNMKIQIKNRVVGEIVNPFPGHQELWLDNLEDEAI